MGSLRQRLLLAESSFLSAVVGGSVAIQSFYVDWLQIKSDIETSLAESHVDTDTLSLAYSTSSTVSLLADTFVRLESESEVMSATLQSDLDLIFAQINLADKSPSPGAVARSPSPSSTPNYIPSAYQWLLSNLHNPYPSAVIKNTLARNAHAPRKDIDGWFVDVRKRIGWNILRKKYFSNRRADIVDAATRFFVQDDPKRPLSAVVELQFAEIESRGKDLYSEKYTESVLASKLDLTVKDLTPEMKSQAKRNSQRGRQNQRQTRSTRDASFYPSPSPEHSPGSSLDLSLSPLATSVEDGLPQCVATSKRPAPFSDGWDNQRPNKRSRNGNNNSVCQASGLPSPPSSLREVSSEPVEISLITQPPPSPSVAVKSVSKRKRRLSDVDGQPQPKRPNNLQLEPRRQTVSDPLPITLSPLGTLSFDDWYQSTFTAGQAIGNIPPVSVEAPDATAPLDIHIHNFSSCDIQPTFTPSIALLSESIALPMSTEVGSTTQSDHDDDPNTFAWFDIGHCLPASLHHREKTLPITSVSTNAPTLAFISNQTGKSISEPIFDWDPIGFSSQTSSQRLGNFSSHISDLSGFSLDASATSIKPTLCKPSLPEKVRKQREPTPSRACSDVIAFTAIH